MKRVRVDWELVRSRLRSSERALEEAMTESPKRIDAAYRQRAIRLAEGQAAPQAASAGLSVLIFRLAQELYAIELEEVAETLPFERCTPVPGSAPHFLGMINLRGELRPVLNLGRLLGLSEDRPEDSGFVLVLRQPGREIGLKVDRIEDLRAIRSEELSAPGQSRYVKGIASGPLMLLNVEAVLAEVFSKEESFTK
jgi:purine-binding chemotaxis protein CheW